METSKTWCCNWGWKWPCGDNSQTWAFLGMLEVILFCLDSNINHFCPMRKISEPFIYIPIKHCFPSVVLPWTITVFLGHNVLEQWRQALHSLWRRERIIHRECLSVDHIWVNFLFFSGMIFQLVRDNDSRKGVKEWIARTATKNELESLHSLVGFPWG